ncbi:hypothetical protein [Nocardioides halotolerans]|uniref:hypothetical protein n=1 Tax=Nocardioides halotolerans TaxID=433660 RepID=UPI00048DA5F3|nr:hypothetical protein [Nocardioides halotolerans]
MEIAPVPHRSSHGDQRRLALGLLVLAPVVLLVLLPAVLGLERTVVSDRSMDGSLARGSVVFVREVPAADLEVGDVISLRPPRGAADDRVSRRIVAVRDGVATTEADRTADRWDVELTSATYARVWLGVPYIGYPFLMGGGWMLLVGAALVALVLAVTAGRRTPQPAVARTRTRIPVA